ncbi:MAG: hypothetical protein M3360_02345, partial [Actinomycetota bacterium]|nr:hypothetical protein [Actinomycetota bacterium]
MNQELKYVRRRRASVLIALLVVVALSSGICSALRRGVAPEGGPVEKAAGSSAPKASQEPRPQPSDPSNPPDPSNTSDAFDPQPINAGFPGLTTFRGNATRTYYGEGPVPHRPHVLWRYPSSGGLCSESTDESG